MCKHRQPMGNSWRELRLLGITLNCWGDVGRIVRIHILAIVWPSPFLKLHFFATKAYTIADFLRKICMNVLRVVSKLLAPFSSFFSNKFPLDSNWIPTKFQMNDWLVGCKFRFPPLTITHNFFCSFFALLSTPTGIYHRRSWGGEWGRVREWLLVARFFLCHFY